MTVVVETMPGQQLRAALPAAASTGAGSVSSTDRGVRDKDAEFSEYMAARQPSLLRTAYLLTGDRHTAEDLVQTALAKLYLNWDKVQRQDSLDGYVRRILVNEHNSSWRRAWKKRETTTSESAEGGGCAVFFNSEDLEEQAAWSATSHGIADTLPKLLAVGGMAPNGSLSGLVSVTDDGSCSVVLDRAWEESWKTCDYSLGQFSPDGRYVIGHPAYRSGIGDTSVAILDAETGDLVAEYQNSEEHPAFINNVVWDVDNTLVATVFEHTWSLMRMTLDGKLTALTGGSASNMDDVPMHFATQP